MSEGGRGKRRCPGRRAAQAKSAAIPSAVHYVGYVEDDETPEMIMRKFEELERIKAAAAASTKQAEENKENTENNSNGSTATEGAPDAIAYGKRPQQPCQQPVAAQTGQQASGADLDTEAGAASQRQQQESLELQQPHQQDGGGEGMTEEMLLEVFKATSAFNVKSALANNEYLMYAADAMFDRDAYEIDGDEDWEEFRGFWSDDEDWDAKRLRKRPRRERKEGEPRERATGGGRAAGGSAYAKPKQHLVSTYNSDTGSFIRRSSRAVADDPYAIQLIKLPPVPIPISWGRRVKPWAPAPQDPSSEAPNAAECDSKVHGPELPAEPLYQGSYEQHQTLESCDFAALRASPPTASGFQAVFINSGWELSGGLERLAKLPIPQLCPVGFVFAWVPKHLLQGVVRLMYSWEYVYVENLTWVQVAPSNAMLELESDYLRTSHLTLYIFRKNGEGKDIELKHQRNPDVTFDCVCRAKGRDFRVPDEVFVAIETLLPNGKGNFLELWAEQGLQRPGWTHIVEFSEP